MAMTEASGEFLPHIPAIIILYIVILQVSWISWSLHWLIADPTTGFLLPSSDTLSSACFLLFLLDGACWASDRTGYSVRLLLPQSVLQLSTASIPFSQISIFEAIAAPLLLLGACFHKVFRPRLEDEHFSWLEVPVPFFPWFYLLDNLSLFLHVTSS